MIVGNPDPAVAQARGVVGLYGDPTVSWSIALDVSLSAPLDLDALRHRCGELVVGRGHLGVGPVPVPFDEDSSSEVLARLLDLPYGNQDPLVRVALDRQGHRLLVAAHHGAVDGLGLLAILSILLGEPAVSTASGIGNQTSPVGFIRSSVSRLVEAVFRPPTRFDGELHAEPGSLAGTGDVTSRVDLAPTRANTARTITAAAQALTAWNAEHGSRTGRIVAAVGASRRDGSDARPDRDTAYLRVRLPATLTEDAVRAALDDTPPEPAFPERPPSRWATTATRLLRRRLGSSLLVSNLGAVEGPEAVTRVAFYPSAAGPQAVAVGVASTSSYTTVTVRMPRADFSSQAADRLCAEIAARLGDHPTADCPGQ